jgi:hypothetical protein
MQGYYLSRFSQFPRQKNLRQRNLFLDISELRLVPTLPACVEDSFAAPALQIALRLVFLDRCG